MAYPATPAEQATDGEARDEANGGLEATVAVSEDHYRNHGSNMLEAALLNAQRCHRALPGWQAEQYANAVHQVMNRVSSVQDQRSERHTALPIEIPRISAPTWERGSKKRERANTAVTGLNLAVQQESEDSR